MPVLSNKPAKRRVSLFFSEFIDTESIGLFVFLYLFYLCRSRLALPDSKLDPVDH